ncbi:hypothetical protein LTR66_008878 [Elasticomyces elasticus]|nr:hypothetical protein LTR66_008878 [Elasticomyces elasticus]
MEETSSVSYNDAASPPVAKSATALTPPTSEDNDRNHKMEDASSDLSDLDLDDEDDEDNEEDITPDHYYDDGRVPVFKPTMKQFRSFKAFIDKIDKYGMKSGIVKIIPPQEWRDSLPALDEYVKSIKIKNPITQEFMGTHGTYTQANIEKQRSYNLPEWKALTGETQNQPPARRGERRRNQEKVVRGGGNIRSRGSTSTAASDTPPAPKRKPGRPRRQPLPEQSKELGDDTKTTRRGAKPRVPPTPTSPNTKPMRSGSGGSDNETSPVKKKGGAKAGNKGGNKGGTQQKSVASRRMNNRTEAAEFIDEKAFKDFDYRLEHLDEFTPERCAELETAYWKSLTFAQPMYAADMPGSLFDDTTTSWNVAKLENLLDVLGTKVPGVNTAYLYLGMWKATFAWHLEDVDLYSINYIHFGAPKQWYSISQEDARRFEAAMRSVWPNDSKNCDQFLRHKTYLISPTLLQSQYNIKVNKLVHNEGEFVITFPYGYHSGYNLGYNCAESVNFATDAWLDYGRIAKKCDCEADSVWVDVADIERKLRGEPTPEYYEETDDSDDEDGGEQNDLLTPPASVKGKPKPRPGKRKRDAKEGDPAKKKRKRIKIRLRVPHKETCVLCPNDAAHEPLLSTDNDRKAHRSCALYTPETYLVEEKGVEKVHNVTGIDRARLDLKCNYCRSKRGACFQCSAKKCTRAFHATCAAAAGVQIDSGMVPTFGEDGTEYFCEGYDFRCRYHRPKRAKNTDADALESSKSIINFARSLKIKDVVQAQHFGGEVFAGIVAENRPAELSLLLDVLPEGDRVEVEWKYLLVLDPEDSQRPKPSANAKPLPADMNKKSVSIDNRQDGMPKMDESFHEGSEQKWAEFFNMDLPPTGYATARIVPPNKLQVDLNKADQLYFYLGKTSTEARPQFTEDLKNPRHNITSNFMERVRSAAPPAKQSERKSLPASYPAGANLHALNAVSRPFLVSKNSSDRPYEYKPKVPANHGYIVDEHSLANQRNFTQQASRDSSVMPQPGQAAGPHASLPSPSQHSYRYQSSNASKGQPLRAFPPDQYYSSKALPAAYPGDYSQYRQHVRQQSQEYEHQPDLNLSSRRQSQYGQQPARGALYQSPSQQRAHILTPIDQCHALGYDMYGANPTQMSNQRLQQQVAPDAPMMRSTSDSASTRFSMGPTTAPCPTPLQENSPPQYRRPSATQFSLTNDGLSATSAPHSGPKPATPAEQGPSQNAAYVNHLKKYPYLRDNYLRKPKVYTSPYPANGGFSSRYMPPPLLASSPTQQESTRPQMQTQSQLLIAPRPVTFTHMGGDDKDTSPVAVTEASIEWTPPSQVYHQHRLDRVHHSPYPPPQHEVPLLAQQQQRQNSFSKSQSQPQTQGSGHPARPQPMYQTPRQFQQQLGQEGVGLRGGSNDGFPRRLDAYNNRFDMPMTNGNNNHAMPPNPYMPTTGFYVQPSGQLNGTAMYSSYGNPYAPMPNMNSFANGNAGGPFYSPKAPTPSPLSEPTSGGTPGLQHNGWGRADIAPMSFGDYAKAGNVSNVGGGMQSGKGVAQVVPNYGVGNETWRYG